MGDKKIREITYVEPADFFPKNLRKKHRIGEYAEITQNKKAQGLRSWESEKFNAFFEIVQSKAKSLEKVFFADAGDGNDFETPIMEGENIMGWLIPNEMVSEFEPIWMLDAVDDNKWSDYYMWAVWFESKGEIKIRFEK